MFDNFNFCIFLLNGTGKYEIYYNGFSNIGGGGHLAISNYWGGLVPLNVYGGYGPASVSNSTLNVSQLSTGFGPTFFNGKPIQYSNCLLCKKYKHNRATALDLSFTHLVQTAPGTQQCSLCCQIPEIVQKQTLLLSPQNSPVTEPCVCLEALAPETVTDRYIIH